MSKYKIGNAVKIVEPADKTCYPSMYKHTSVIGKVGFVKSLIIDHSEISEQMTYEVVIDDKSFIFNQFQLELIDKTVIKMASALGVKYDSDKLKWSLLPIAPLRLIIRVLMFGVGKYGLDNWQKVDNPKIRYYDALQRHITAWKDGELLDPESGLSHMAHAGSCVLFIIWFEIKEKLYEF